jgi:hypothetical protein
MNFEAFNNLELIPKLLKKIETMEERLSKLTPPITTKREVANFLNVSTRTINNYIEQGLLQNGKHYHRKNGKILVFMEDAILEFRNKRDKGMV